MTAIRFCQRSSTRKGASLVEELYRWRGKKPPVDRVDTVTYLRQGVD